MKVYIVFYYDGGASNQCLGVEEYDVLVELSWR